MERKQPEKRQFPRITASIPIKITPEFLGETVNISEAGLQFALQKPFLLSKAKAIIEIAPGKSIETEFKVLWNKHLAQNGKFAYGGCFMRLKEKDMQALRSLLMDSCLQSIIDNITDKKQEERIIEFWNNDFRNYLESLIKISDSLEKGADQNEAVKKVTEINDLIVKKGDELERFLDNKLIIKRIKRSFRELCGPWVYRSQIVKHAFKKPHGYPGDNELIEIIYNNTPLSKNIGYCYDKYLLNNPYAVAVRNRKDKMKETLRSIIKESAGKELCILNLACGSCREIRELLNEDKSFSDKTFNFSLVDQDENALQFSKNQIKESPNKIRFNYFQHNVLSYSEEKDTYSKLLGRQDIIYSIGLADYLPDRLLKNLITFCFWLLNKSGKLIIAHKDITQYKPLPPDWWCDWIFHPRDENYLLNLIKKSGLTDFNIKVEREPSKIIFFLTIEKIK